MIIFNFPGSDLIRDLAMDTIVSTLLARPAASIESNRQFSNLQQFYPFPSFISLFTEVCEASVPSNMVIARHRVLLYGNGGGCGGMPSLAAFCNRSWSYGGPPPSQNSSIAIAKGRRQMGELVAPLLRDLPVIWLWWRPPAIPITFPLSWLAKTRRVGCSIADTNRIHIIPHIPQL